MLIFTVSTDCREDIEGLGVVSDVVVLFVLLFRGERKTAGGAALRLCFNSLKLTLRSF